MGKKRKDSTQQIQQKISIWYIQYLEKVANWHWYPSENMVEKYHLGEKLLKQLDTNLNVILI